MSERRKSGIYCITNKVNGKRYIGQAISIGDRWLTHRSHLNCKRHHSVHLQSSWNKHGVDAFEFSVLEYVAKDKDSLAQREQYWMQLLQPEFNVAPSAGSSLGMKHPPRSEEFRKRMSELKKGFKHTDEAKALFRSIAAEKIAKGSIYRPTPEHKEKLRLANLGKKPSAESIKKAVEARALHAPTAEAIAKRVASNTGKRRTPEQCRRIGDALRGKVRGKQSPELIERRICHLRGKKRPDVALMLAGKKRPQHVVDALRKANEDRYKARIDRLVHAISNEPTRSIAAIARLTGCDRETVSKYKRQLAALKS